MTGNFDPFHQCHMWKKAQCSLPEFIDQDLIVVLDVTKGEIRAFKFVARNGSRVDGLYEPRDS
jgi:hypothetical protein